MNSVNRQFPLVLLLVVITIVVGQVVFHRFGLGDHLNVTASVAESVVRSNDAASRKMPQPPSVDQSDDDTATAAPWTALLKIGFDVAHTASRAGNDLLDQVAGLTTQEEVELGREAYMEATSRLSVIADPVSQQRIERLAIPFLNARKRKRIAYHFTIIDEGSVNAFAHLGGYVYVNRGLLEAVQDDAELEFVIGHEIAHVDRRHCVKNMTALIRAQQTVGELGGSLASLAFRAIAVGYSEDFEFEADHWSYRQLRNIGRSHEQVISGLEMLQRVFGSDGDHHAHGPVVIEQLESHFRTHPRIADRLQQLELAKVDFGNM